MTPEKRREAIDNTLLWAGGLNTSEGLDALHGLVEQWIAEARADQSGSIKPRSTRYSPTDGREANDVHIRAHRRVAG